MIWRKWLCPDDGSSVASWPISFKHSTKPTQLRQPCVRAQREIPIRTFLRTPAEDHEQGNRISEREAERDEEMECPVASWGELGRYERGYKCAEPVRGVQSAHLRRAMFINRSDVPVCLRILAKSGKFPVRGGRSRQRTFTAMPNPLIP